MALTALDVQQQSFGTARHGYDPQEVDVFLERVATEVENFNRALLEAKTRYEEAEARALSAEQHAAIAQPAVAAAATEEQISRAFIAAQRSAEAIKDEARVDAEKVYREAEQHARDMVRDTMAEKKHIVDEIEHLRSSCEKFRAEYISLLEHFSVDARKKIPVLEANAPDISNIRPDLPITAPGAPDFATQNDATVQPAAPPAAEAASAPAAKAAPATTAEATVAMPLLDTEPADKPAPAPSTPAPASKPAPAANELDDDLDIEEID
ncbi:MAG: DivIVA domain-containing protein [Coriobacteriia bacterium]|nr:DivIVA domain-containing protein [Coriobacteriia bacterium]